MINRLRHIKRPYSLKDIQSLQIIKRSSPGLKLYNVLRNHYENKTASITFGIMDPVQAVQTVKSSSGQITSLYVSGWTCSSTASSSHEPGPDFADYPYNTVPEKVKQLQKSLEFHGRIQHAEGKSEVDYDIPIIADADTGHGGLTSVMKLTKLMIEAGAGGIHLEDQHSENKRCGHLGGRILVPIQKHIHRLMAARLQADIMNDDLVLIARTDAESACFIESNIDKRDQPFISGKQTHEGYFPINGGNEFAITRALAFAPYADLVWMETHRPDYQQAELFAKRIHEKYPEMMLAYNLSPSFNWDSEGMSEDQLKDFSRNLAKLGYVWQFITLGGFHINALATSLFVREFVKDGVWAYVKNIQRKEKEHQIETLKHQEWSGINLRAEELNRITKLSNDLRSKGMTEDKF